MSEGKQHSWSDIGRMINRRILELFDAVAAIFGIGAFAFLLYLFVEGGVLVGQSFAISLIALAVIPNAIAQALHRLYDD